MIAPDGSRNRVARGEVEIGQPVYPELPSNIQVALPISFEADEPGTYQVECEVTSEQATIAQTTNVYVTQQRPPQR